MAQIELDGIKFTADNSTLSTGASKFEKFGNALNDDFSEEAMEANGGLQ